MIFLRILRKSGFCLLLAALAMPPSYAHSAGAAEPDIAGAEAPAAESDGEVINAAKYFAASGFPKGEQRRLARRLLGKQWLQDVEAEEYLQRIAKNLAPLDEHFIAVADTDAVNAFAYIGGIMVMYRGLWEFAEEEDGFVGVVAHEMGHIKLDHVQKSRDNAERASTLATPFLIAGLLIDDPEVREAVVAGSAGLLSSDIIAYSRELEHEADIFALNKMLSAERNAWAMARIFTRLGSGGKEYLSTHPASDRRGAYLADRLHGTIPELPSSGLEYYLLREKFSRYGVVERQYAKSKRAVLASETATEKQKLLARYGLLLAATKTRNKALGAEMTALLAGQDSPLIARALAKNMAQRGESAEALKLLQEARRRHPQRAALTLEQFALRERLGQHDKILAEYAQLPPALAERSDVLHAAGRAAALMKKRLLSNYLLALSQAHDGEFEQALRQIAIAEQFKDGDTETVVKLEALKKKVKRELKLLRERRVLEKS